MESEKEVIIIGAGASGLMVAAELKKRGLSNFIVLEAGPPVERRKCPDPTQCRLCDQCQILIGVGGAGLFSDGKMNFSDKIGGDIKHILSEKTYSHSLNHLINSYGFEVEHPGEISHLFSSNSLQKSKATILKVPQAHIGSDNLPKFIRSNFGDVLNHILDSCRVESVKKNRNRFYIHTPKGKFVCRHLIVATGQAGADFAANIAKFFQLNIYSSSADLGVRLEVRNHIVKDLIKFQRDPKIYFHTDYGDVRTFCTNPAGYIITEAKNGTVTCNGHAMKTQKSENTNFALMYKIKVNNPRRYLLNIARNITDITGNKLLLQKADDFVNTAETKNLTYTRPTTDCFNIGNMANFIPYKPYNAIRDSLLSLNSLFPNFFDDGAILYAPEIKLYTDCIKLKNEGFESKIEQLYFLGDCCGHIHGLTNAMISAIACAEHICS